MADMKPFVEKIDLSLAGPLKANLVERGCEVARPQYTVFQAKKKGLSVTLYESGKLVVQGKEMQEFIEFYLEPEVLKTFNFTYSAEGAPQKGGLQKDTPQQQDASPRVGIDESGKGDVFGPLCVGGVFAGGDQIEQLVKLGVVDSKKLTDDRAHKLAAKIKKMVPWHVVRVNPFRYNELYGKFNNLNRFLAWGHATVIEKLAEQTGCKKVIVDQFAAEWVVESALKKKGLEMDLTQRTKAESDVVVAAASILAREAFLTGLAKLSKDWGLTLPKGAGPKVKEAGRRFLSEHGREELGNIAKMHFKTVNEF